MEQEKRTRTSKKQNDAFGEGDQLLTAFLIKIYKRKHQDPIGKTMLGPFHKPKFLAKK